MRKPYYSIIFLVLVSLVTGILTNFTRFQYYNRSITKISDRDELNLSQESNLIVGVSFSPIFIDPHYAFDPSSYNVIYQVCEGLFTYNYSDPSNEIIPRLASDYGTWSTDDLNYTVSIRQDVTFHDGTSFNATAIIWNYNRLCHVTNISGTLTSIDDLTDLMGFYLWPDGAPIINRIEIIDPYTIKYVLNKPFGAFEALLCFTGSYFVSPTTTDPLNRIDTLTGDLIGTGPYVYDEYIEDSEVRFQAYNDYWRGPAEISSLVFTIIPDIWDQNYALLDGEIDVLLCPLPDFFDIFNERPDITLDDQGDRSGVIFYIGMNNNQINQTFREAISYAVDYDYILNEIRNPLITERLQSPIPKGIFYSNYSYNVPCLDLSYARELMQTMGFGGGFTSDAQWESATFATFNYSYPNWGGWGPLQTRLLQLLKNNLTKIGIKIDDAGIDTWQEYLGICCDWPPYHRNMFQLFFAGWAPEYNDPSQFINMLFSNITDSRILHPVIPFNVQLYNGGYGGFEPYDENNDVQILMDKALNTTDKDERKWFYNKIQKLMIERDFPVLWLYTWKLYVAYNSDIEGFQENMFYTQNQDGDASLQGDIIYLKWKDIPTNGEPAISGYQPAIFGIIFLIFIYTLIRKKNKILKIK